MKLIFIGTLLFCRGYLAINEELRKYIQPTSVTHTKWEKPYSPYFKYRNTINWPRFTTAYSIGNLTNNKQFIISSSRHISIKMSLEEQIMQTTKLIAELLMPENPKTSKEICQEIITFHELLETYPKLKPIIENQLKSPNINTFFAEYRCIDFKTELPKTLADISYEIIGEFQNISYWEQGKLYLRLQKKFK